MRQEARERVGLPKDVPLRNDHYLAWLRRQPCVVCRIGAPYRAVEAAHVGVRGMGSKISDYFALPLCHDHHRGGQESYHRMGKDKLAERYRLNYRELFLEHLSGYLEYIRAAPFNLAVYMNGALEEFIRDRVDESFDAAEYGIEKLVGEIEGLDGQMV